jgi:hypothetical protein
MKGFPGSENGDPPYVTFIVPDFLYIYLSRGLTFYLRIDTREYESQLNLCTYSEEFSLTLA